TLFRSEDRGIAIRLPHNVRVHIKDDAHLGRVGLLAVLGENALDREHKEDVASFLRPPVGLVDQHLPILPPRLFNGLREVGILPLPAGKRPPVDPQSLADLPLRPKLSHKPKGLSLPLLLQLHEALGSLPLQLVLLLRGSFECLLPGHAITPYNTQKDLAVTPSIRPQEEFVNGNICSPLEIQRGR